MIDRWYSGIKQTTGNQSSCPTTLNMTSGWPVHKKDRKVGTHLDFFEATRLGKFSDFVEEGSSGNFCENSQIFPPRFCDIDQLNSRHRHGMAPLYI
jgi:hypothetical protein